jgi:L-fuculose-phosphate aldolase
VVHLAAEREAVVAVARRMATSGLVINTSGNVSLRAGRWIAITPGSMDYDAMSPADVCLVDVETGEADRDSRVPSSELPLHLEIYRQTSAGAVVHTHSHYATVLSTLEDRLPPIHYQIADLGGEVLVAPYATFGSPELAALTARYLGDRNAVLMRNHGATTVAPDVWKALARAFTLEWIASVYWHARTLGSPSLLDADELRRVSERHRALATLRADNEARRAGKDRPDRTST